MQVCNCHEISQNLFYVECGLTNVQGAVNDNYVPWLVSIYDSQKSFNVCWGTLISPYTVVTGNFVILDIFFRTLNLYIQLFCAAAHCVFDESTNRKKDTSNIFITVGKHLIGGTEDDDTKQYYRVNCALCIGNKSF